MRIIVICSALVVAGCGKPVPSMTPVAHAETPVKPAEAAVVNLQLLGGFDYKEHMELSAEVQAWNGRRVKATGYINPTDQARGITQFFLVKDLSTCCYGKRPQMNHYVNIALKPGQTVNFSRDAVTIVGTLKIEDRWDGDWQLGLYWIEDGEVAR
jgi:hypothetical protein